MDKNNNSTTTQIMLLDTIILCMEWISISEEKIKISGTGLRAVEKLKLRKFFNKKNI